MDMVSLCLSGVRLMGWTLVHFLWQATLIGLVYVLVRMFAPRGEARYRVGMAALVLLAICPGFTLWYLLGHLSSGWPASDDGWLPVQSVHAGVMHADSPAWSGVFDAVMPWLVLTWLAGVFFLSLRAWRQWRHLKHLVRLGESLLSWQQWVSGVSARFGLRRRVEVLCSRMVDTPVLVGWLRPVILLPVAVVTGFPGTQIEWILAHELAHLRRWDPLANLLQVILETLHFYHPVVHWISRDVRNERELCCDDLALSLNGGSRRDFATALARLGELRVQRHKLMLAAGGGVLLERVRHLAMPVPTARVSRIPARHTVILVGAFLLALIMQSAWQQVGMQDRVIGAVTPWLDMPGHSVSTPMSWKLADLVPTHLQSLHIDSASSLQTATDLPAITPATSYSTVAPPLQIKEQVPEWVVTHPVISTVRPQDESQTLPVATEALVSVRASPPEYPSRALEHGIEGRVVLAFALGADGSVRDPHVLSATPAGIFDHAAIAAISGWKFKVPAGVSGQKHYRQVMVFSVHEGDGQTAGDVTAAHKNCHIVTGSLICRELSVNAEREVSMSVMAH